MESTSILHRTTESERGLMVGGIYKYLTIKNKHMNLSFLIKVLVSYWEIAYGKITIRFFEDKLVRFLVQESQSQSSSHDFLLLILNIYLVFPHFPTICRQIYVQKQTHKSN